MTLLRRWDFSKILKQVNEKSLWISTECISCRRARKSKGPWWSRHECSRSNKKATVAEVGTWQERQAERQVGYMGSSLIWHCEDPDFCF